MTEHIRKTDRRTERTRQLLRDALIELIVEKKAYDAVSIQDITDRADVARTTFYLHYRDKDELLFSSLRDIYEHLFQTHHVKSPEAVHDGLPVPAEIDARDFEHVRENADFYRTMLSNNGSLIFMLSVLRYLGDAMGETMLKPLAALQDTPRVPIDLVASFFAGAQVGVTDWWVRNNFKYTPQQVAAAMHYLSLASLAWALRLDVQPPDVTIP
jgi:AcrR family transcriptional regulator